MDRERVVGAVGFQGQPAAGTIETAVGDPVRPGDQREAAEFARQAVFHGLRSRRAQQGRTAAKQGPVDEAGAQVRGEGEAGEFVFEMEKRRRHVGLVLQG
ncbi:hypothetical protein D3C81_1976140 [compost metagenome]